jgi:Nuclease-related domain
VLTIELSDHPGDLLSAATKRREAADKRASKQYDRELADVLKQRDDARSHRKWLTWLRLAYRVRKYKQARPRAFSVPTDDEEILKAGIAGEQRVAKELGIQLGNAWTLVHGYRNGRGEIDHLLLGPNGLFAIEVKNNNATITIHGDVWEADKYDRYGNRREHYTIADRGGRSPSVQLNQSADALESFLHTRGQQIGVQRVVALTHARSKLASHEELTVHVAVSTDQILGLVRAGSDSLDPRRCGAILNIIEHDHAFHERRRASKGRR